MIKGRTDVQEAYRDEDTAREYIARRFETPIGALLHGRQVATLRDLIRENQLTRALEIAPGPARVTTDVVSLLSSVTLVDASLQMLHQAHRRLAAAAPSARVHLLQSDAFRLPLAGRFDLAFTFRLIRHFERHDRLALYRQLAGVLSPGGWLVFDAINRSVAEAYRARDASELKHFDALLTADELRAELTESGFRVERLVGVQHRVHALRWCQIYIAPRSDALARAAMAVLDGSGGEPLEWVVVCRRA
jgi:ubiquinone/menaquinone biosynthesis C-methylase UbiE